MTRGTVPALSAEPRFRDVAAKLVLWAIEYLDDASACPCCTLGHEPMPDDQIHPHDEGCPLRGFDLTSEVEALRSWATHRVGTA